MTSATRLASWYNEIDNRDDRSSSECDTSSDENNDRTDRHSNANEGIDEVGTTNREVLVVENECPARDDEDIPSIDATDREVLVVEKECSPGGGDGDGNVDADDHGVLVVANKSPPRDEEGVGIKTDIHGIDGSEDGEDEGRPRKLVVENGCSPGGGDGGGDGGAADRGVLAVEKKYSSASGERISDITTNDRRVRMVEKLRKEMRDKATHTNDDEAVKVEHDADRTRVTWADENGDNIQTTTVSSRLRYGSGRRRDSHTGRRVTA